MRPILETIIMLILKALATIWGTMSPYKVLYILYDTYAFILLINDSSEAPSTHGIYNSELVIVLCFRASMISWDEIRQEGCMDSMPVNNEYIKQWPSARDLCTRNFFQKLPSPSWAFKLQQMFFISRHPPSVFKSRSLVIDWMLDVAWENFVTHWPYHLHSISNQQSWNAYSPS